MIAEELKNETGEPAHDAVVHNYDPTQLYTCIDEVCPHRGYIVHFLAPFKIGWTDDKGQMHNDCRLKPLPKPEPGATEQETKPFLRVKELGGTRTRLIQTRVGAEQAEARALANRAREQNASSRGLPPWMLRPCPLKQIPTECMLGLDACQDAKFCFKRRLAEYRSKGK